MSGGADVIAARAPGFRPRIALILGSGLGSLADAVADPVVIPYADLPGFHVSTVAGHAGRLVLGELAGVPVACLQGRAHVYEGVDSGAIRTPIRALRAAGAQALLITSASGSLRREVGPGRLLLVTDHINLMGVNPLTGPNDDDVGPRFPSMRDAYDPELRAAIRAAAHELDIPLAEGVYLAAAGPSFETPAEIRAFRTLGADAVGMSMVPETIVARHCGLKVAAIATITNLAEGMAAEPLSHEQTLRSAERAAGDLRRLIDGFLDRL